MSDADEQEPATPGRGSWDRRFPRWVFGQGIEPDPRFTLANERTFLAWIRTSLALVAGGVALEVFGLELHDGFRTFASFLLIAAGVVAPVQAWLGWASTEKALRLNRHLPASVTALSIVVLVGAAGFLVLLALVFA